MSKPYTPLCAVLDGRQNNLNLLRLVFALMVLVTHSYPLTRGAGPQGSDFAAPYLRFSLGTLGVFGFFFISGLLVTRSLLSRCNLMDFLRARCLRIFPGLVVVLLVTGFIVGPLATELPPTEYFSSRDTLTYIPYNLLLIFQIDKLPGVFTSNPFPNAVNGSLWTLPIEFSCYIALGAVWACVRTYNRKLSHLVAAVWIIMTALFMMKLLLYPLVKLALYHHAVPGEWGKMLYFTLSFCCGSLVYILRKRIVLSLPISLCMLIAGIVTNYALLFTEVIFLISFFYFVLSAAFFKSKLLLTYNNIGDLSYGVYIYTFPIQQLIAWRLHDVSAMSLCLLALPPTLLCAALSWHFVEKPALALKATSK